MGKTQGRFGVDPEKVRRVSVKVRCVSREGSVSRGGGWGINKAPAGVAGAIR